MTAGNNPGFARAEDLKELSDTDDIEANEGLTADSNENPRVRLIKNVKDDENDGDIELGETK